MKVGVIGGGRVGMALAGVWSEAGHDVVVAFARDSAQLAERAGAIGATADEPSSAVAGADVVVWAVPWDAAGDALTLVGDLAGSVILDATNALGAGLERSAAEELASRLPRARVVKAFNTVFAQLFEGARAEPEPPSLVVCGDDPDAKDTVATLVRDAGFVPIDVGGLEQSGDVEAFARLVIGLAYREQRGPFFYRFGPGDIDTKERR